MQEDAFEESQKYKVGKYILEKARLKKCNAWHSAPLQTNIVTSVESDEEDDEEEDDEEEDFPIPLEDDDDSDDEESSRPSATSQTQIHQQQMRHSRRWVLMFEL